MQCHINACGFCLAVVALLAAPAHGQEVKAVGKGIDAATVAAYEKLGAVYGGWGKGSRFEDGRDKAEKGLPGFKFQSFPASKLPEVAVSFGLIFSYAEVTEAGLKEVAGLKNLAVLVLAYTQVTDVGMKELAGLKNLSRLYLAGTEGTDAGMKELASHKNLTLLHLYSTKVTDAGLKEVARLKRLTSLDLGATQVTDSGLKELAGLKNLTAYFPHIWFPNSANYAGPTSQPS